MTQQPNPYQQPGPYGQPSPYQQPAPYQQQAWPGYQTHPTGPRNGLGTAGLVLGIIAVCFGFIPLGIFFIWPASVLAIVFGAIGHHRANHGEATNKRSAMWGWLLGVASIVIVPIMSLLIFRGAI